ncbi:hypothetical protein BDI4_620003 [Burkholderia diffusa]|nr:hypothetical protein BDI4_620003 [Burkholderia diffusa]
MPSASSGDSTRSLRISARTRAITAAARPGEPGWREDIGCSVVVHSESRRGLARRRHIGLFCVGGRPKTEAGGAWIRTYEYTEFILQNLSSSDCAVLWHARRINTASKSWVRHTQGAHDTGNRRGFLIR